MKMRWGSSATSLRVGLVVVLSGWGTACAGSSAGNEWAGSYVYHSAQGLTAGGSPIVTEYKLNIGDKKSDCALEVQGFQVDEVILCSLEHKGKQTDIRFASYEGGSVENAYGVQVYDPGEILFTLQKTASEPVTVWRAMAPDEKLAEKGVYFQKQTSR